ncbi:molybdenum ABC transporter ATP-binding protein [Parvibaculum sp.]|jgi:molybdate transport system ATP-binding protein|uniref:molybdenum ABC transporter ATP-binding protein n=1 Tax=Parvibaculum sp. TaxID=2024848 RepID=UPI001B1789B3|nr:molybdenum ABC transporter ATP-binding protein [Parvibaculum sp.]MBO6635721.1 molybdenum ABC transporter ATP-binding protein [Parvibaculum sp.]MBO6680303.1 molybdenum ABC transporter ATP-binding protein [Parvibaculum sp.]MBO6686550.1 molybdenum ABC transporter ATP-binding protein [Parvibaculum sp.]MBO6904706.1 molybdenum ABC transporter ATP-binding protein [Parvibaculum sp.]
MIALTASIERRAGGFSLDVSFEAPPGVTGIIGPSGAGKTMALQAIAGLNRPDKARIALGDEVFIDTADGISLPPEKRNIGYVFQEARLFPHMTVAANLDYGAKRRGPGAPASRAEVIELLGIAPLLERHPASLSGGEAQRVAIGRALLSAPRLLLMDEPLASLDIRRRREIMPFLEALHERLRLPVLFVSHNIDEIVRLADRVIVLHGGRIAAKGGVGEVLNRLDVQNLILGEAEDDSTGTILDAKVLRHDDADGLTEVGGEGFRLVVSKLVSPEGTPVRLRLRAKDVALATAAPSNLSIQNVIEGTIRLIEDASAGQVSVTLETRDRGAAIHALVTGRAARLLGLKKGMPVWALIKSVAIAGGK